MYRERVRKIDDKYKLNSYEIEVLDNNKIRVNGNFVDYTNLESTIVIEKTMKRRFSENLSKKV